MSISINNNIFFETQQYFDSVLEQSPPAEVAECDEQQNPPIEKELQISSKNLAYGKNNKRNNSLLTEEEAESVVEKIYSSETRISFNGAFIENILQEGYKHWSLLDVTNNTENLILFIQRLHSEFSLFNIKVYNDNVITRANNLFSTNPEDFVKNWNAQFETNFSLPIKNVEDLFIETGFSKGKLLREVIFGALFHEGRLLQVGSYNEDVLAKYYGKSQIILSKKAVERSTYCLGDTFDASPDSFEWHNIEKRTATDVLFRLSDRENVLCRLMSLYGAKSQIPYIENHLFERVKPAHIAKILLDPNELSCDTEERSAFVRQMERTYNVAIHIVNVAIHIVNVAIHIVNVAIHIVNVAIHIV